MTPVKGKKLKSSVESHRYTKLNYTQIVQVRKKKEVKL